jgi:hypothetical protein
MEESKEIFVRPKACKFDSSDLPVIQNLLALGYTEADVGMLLGYQGSNWKISAGKTLEEYREAINNGLRMADASMVENLCREAFGYEWEEVKTSYKAITDYNSETGEVETKMVPQGKTVTKKRQPGNSRLAELLATNRLPDLFKRVSEIKKSSLEAKAELTEDQIGRLIGRLLEVVGTKQIESKVID